MSVTLFEECLQRWHAKHVSIRFGESRQRLAEGLGYAEYRMLQNIWFPAFGHFQHLHPEYEIRDYDGGHRFLDFAYIRAHVRIAIEMDGYEPQLHNMNRKQICDQWVRQMQLTNDNWIVIRIGYDDIEHRPHIWQQLLQQMISRLFGDSSMFHELLVHEREILRMAARLERPFQISDVKASLHCCYNTARQHVRSLEKNEWIKPLKGGTARSHSWILEPATRSFIY